MQIRIGGELFDLNEGITVVGRSADADLTIDSTRLSRQHTRFILQGKTLTVEDLGSKNGTFVNGAKISSKTELKYGDSLKLADIECSVSFPEAEVQKKNVLPAKEKPAATPQRRSAQPSGKSNGPLKLGIAVAVIIICFVVLNIVMNQVPQEQLDAREMLAGAKSLIEGTPAEDSIRKGQLENLLKELRLVSPEFTAEHGQALEYVDRVRNEISAIDNRIREKQIAEKVTAALLDIRTNFDNGEIDSEQALKFLESLFDEYQASAMVPRITTEILHVREVEKSNNRKKVRMAVRDVEKLLREGQFQSALITLEQSVADLKAYVDEEDLSELTGMKDRIVTAGSAKLEEAIDRAKRRAVRDDCAEVMDEFERSFNTIGLRQLRARYKEAYGELEKIAARRKAEARAALEKKLKTELSQIEELRKKRKYITAAQIFETVLSKTSDDGLKDLIKNRMKKNALYAAAQEAVITFITGRGELSVKGLGTITGITETAINLMIDGAQMPITWENLKKDEFTGLILRTVDNQKTAILNLAYGYILLDSSGEKPPVQTQKMADVYIGNAFRMKPALKAEYPEIYTSYIERKGAEPEAIAVVKKDKPGKSKPGVYAFRDELLKQHPRLYFTKAEIPELAKRARGDRSWFTQKLRADFEGRSFGTGKGIPGNMEVWHQHMYGIWALTGADFLAVFENNSKYADVCRKWAIEFTKKPFWGKSSGSWAEPLSHFDVVSGVAITYDILYDKFTEQERSAIRDWLLKEIKYIHGGFDGTIDLGGYWINDHLNNHMHNRLHGLAHAVLAIYGDDPKQDLSRYVDFVMEQYKEQLKWLPDDGSYHEGPGYWGFGFHWCLRMAFLMKHVTTADPFADNTHFIRGHLFRLYMQAPGWDQIMPIGDTGEGKGGMSSLSTLAIGASAANDLYSLDLVKVLMNRQPGGFYQQTAWGMLYYDGTSQTRSYKELPLHCFWPDLEMFSIRSSWEDDASALVFKCGPPGGHHLQKVRKGGYANVAHDDPDQGHFLLYAHGTLLTQGDGYVGKNGGHKAAANHNTVIINGKGQGREGGGWYQPFDYKETGYMKDVFLSHRSAYAAGDVSPLYPGAKFIRHIAFVDGEYVILVDELAGAKGEAQFDWRIHNDGSWKKDTDSHVVCTENGVNLDVSFLAPDTSSLSASVFGKKGPVYGGVSVKHKAAAAVLVSLVVPSKGAAPKLDPMVKQSGGAVVVVLKGQKFTDTLIVSQGGGARTDDITLKGTAALVRMKGDRPVTALMIRGTSLKVAGDELLSCSKQANVSWHDTPKGTIVEAEGAYISRKNQSSPRAPYRSGGSATVRAADFKGRGAVYIDGEAVSSAKPGSDGVLSLKVDLSQRTTIKK